MDMANTFNSSKDQKQLCYQQKIETAYYRIGSSIFIEMNPILIVQMNQTTF